MKKFVFWIYEDDRMYDNFHTTLNHLDCVEVKRGDILENPADIIVSAANSFGFMDGGLDKKYIQFFGEDLEKRVKEKIQSRYLGECLVGQCFSVKAPPNKLFNQVLVAPTMRTPGRLPSDSPNVYLAMKAIVDYTNHLCGNEITVSLPALGCGIGGYDSLLAAENICLAIERFSNKGEWYPTNFRTAVLPGDNRRYMFDHG